MVLVNHPLKDTTVNYLCLRPKEQQTQELIIESLRNCCFFHNPIIRTIKNFRSKAKHVSDLLDMIGAHHHANAGSHAKPASNVPFLPGLMHNKQSEVLQQLSAVTAASSGGEQLPDDSFFETLMKCQGSRIEEQRSSLPNNQRPAPTVPDEDFFSLIHKLQGSRYVHVYYYPDNVQHKFTLPSC